MPLVTTKEMFKKAYEGGYAIGAFNINNLESIQGIIEACKEKNSAVILQCSTGAIKYAGIEYLGADEIPNRIQKIESVDRESVLALANKIKLDTIFFLEGGEEHEEEPPKAF